jgi:hypothetical protein
MRPNPVRKGPRRHRAYRLEAPNGRNNQAQANEALKKPLKYQNIFSQRREVEKGAKKTWDLHFAAFAVFPLGERLF